MVRERNNRNQSRHELLIDSYCKHIDQSKMLLFAFEAFVATKNILRRLERKKERKINNEVENI